MLLFIVLQLVASWPITGAGLYVGNDLFPPYPELGERKNVVVVGAERIAGIIEDFFAHDEIFDKRNVIYRLSVINQNIRAGNVMNKSLDAVSRLMQLPEVDNIIMKMKLLKNTFPADPTLRGIVNAQKKFIDLISQAQADLKSFERSVRFKGCTELEEAMRFFYGHLWSFFDIQIIKD